MSPAPLGRWHPSACRDRDAMRIFHEHGATKVTCGVISATGEVIEEREPEEEREGSSA